MYNGTYLENAEASGGKEFMIKSSVREDNCPFWHSPYYFKTLSAHTLNWQLLSKLVQRVLILRLDIKYIKKLASIKSHNFGLYSKGDLPEECSRLFVLSFLNAPPSWEWEVGLRMKVGSKYFEKAPQVLLMFSTLTPQRAVGDSHREQSWNFSFYLLGHLGLC